MSTSQTYNKKSLTLTIRTGVRLFRFEKTSAGLMVGTLDYQMSEALICTPSLCHPIHTLSRHHKYNH